MKNLGVYVHLICLTILIGCMALVVMQQYGWMSPLPTEGMENPQYIMTTASIVDGNTIIKTMDTLGNFNVSESTLQQFVKPKSNISSSS